MISVSDEELKSNGYTEVVCQNEYGEVVLRDEDGDLELFMVRDSYSGWSISTDCGRSLEFVRSIYREDCQ